MKIKRTRNESRGPVWKFDGTPDTENKGGQRSQFNNKTFPKTLNSCKYQDNTKNNIDVILKIGVGSENWGKNTKKEDE